MTDATTIFSIFDQNAEMSIFDQLFFYVVYTFVWGALYLFLGLFKEHHLFRSSFQRINWTSAVQYLIATPLFTIALLQTAEPLGYDLRAPLLMQHAMAMTVGYFIVAITHSFVTGQKERTGLIHHFFFGLIHIVLLAWGGFPRFWMWIMVAQIPSILFHPMIAISKSDKVPKTVLLAIERLHLKIYIGFRLLFQNIAGMAIIVYDFSGQVSTPLVFWSMIIPVLLVSVPLNWGWYKQAKKHIRKTEAIVEGS